MNGALLQVWRFDEPLSFLLLIEHQESSSMVTPHLESVVDVWSTINDILSRYTKYYHSLFHPLSVAFIAGMLVITKLTAQVHPFMSDYGTALIIICMRPCLAE